MKFVSKVIDPCTSFWVEDYTDEEREFFLSIGFTETIYKMPESFGGDQRNLGYQGSKPFGYWSQEEINKIAHAIYEQFPNIEQIEVFQHIPD